MAEFRLSEDNINRLKAKFDEFQRERAKLHELIINYIADNRMFQGTLSERRDFMYKKYSKRAVSMSHLIYDDNLNEFYWQTCDIELLLGRNQSTISRTFLNMEKSEMWRSRLLELRKLSKSPNGNKIYVYKQGIFDLIFDHYEEEYLLRFALPRRGDKEKAPDINEVRKFWNYLKTCASAEAEFKITSHNGEFTELADIPPLSIKEIIALMWHKAFNAQIMTVTSVIIALCFFITYYCKYAGFILIAASIFTFAVSIIAINKFRNNTEFLLNLGAAAMLFTMSWGAYMLSQNYYQPNIPHNKLTLVPELSTGRDLIFRVSANNYENIKEIFYKISLDENFKSTGFNDFNYPNLIIKPDRNKINDFIDISVKYIDSDGSECGTWDFSFNKNFERLRLSKDFFINDYSHWLHQYYSPNRIIVSTSDFNSDYADDVVTAVAYGINTDNPDKILNLNKFNESNIILNVKKSKNYKYITSYLIFNDGTSSDVTQRLDLK